MGASERPLRGVRRPQPPVVPVAERGERLQPSPPVAFVAGPLLGIRRRRPSRPVRGSRDPTSRSLRLLPLPGRPRKRLVHQRRVNSGESAPRSTFPSLTGTRTETTCFEDKRSTSSGSTMRMWGALRSQASGLGDMVAELSAVYEPKSKTKVKVLDFVQSGGLHVLYRERFGGRFRCRRGARSRRPCAPAVVAGAGVHHRLSPATSGRPCCPTGWAPSSLAPCAATVSFT